MPGKSAPVSKLTKKRVKLLKTLLTQEKQNIMNKGTVKFFNETKGFGFIKDENGQEIFVHVTGLKEEIRENDEVVYDVQDGKKGLNAVNVSLA